MTTKYRIHVGSRSGDRPYINAENEQRAKTHPINGSWTLEEIHGLDPNFQGWVPVVARTFRDHRDIRARGEKSLFVWCSAIVKE